MSTHEALRNLMAGRFARLDYNNEYITVQIFGMKAQELNDEQLDYIKRYYNRPNARHEVLTYKPYIPKVLRIYI